MEKQYDFKQAEPELQRYWEREQIYRFDPGAPGEVYSIDTPPPTVSGRLHIGHLFSYTQTEMIARYRRMQGYNVFYPFGFDDNGLPTERLVEREQNLRAKDLPRREFSALCAKTARAYEAEFRELWKSMGFSADWALGYETSGPEMQALSQKLFLELVSAGRAYLKESPVLWCTECQTSIAQAELEGRELESAFHQLPFVCGDEVIPVATTRPELLYGCVCLFVHPEDERYKRFAGKQAKVPLYGYEIPVLTDSQVDSEKGTGAVMCATFGDSTDVQWFETHRLPYRKVLLPDGTLDPAVPFVGGLTVHGARKELLRLLDEQGLLLRSEPLTHTVAVHERCGHEIEIIPSRQWYIDVLSQKERLLQAADGIRWNPPQMKSRYTAWVENLKWDWCVSRQRYFGVPIPVWYCKSCGKPAYPRPEQLPVNPADTPFQGVCACGCKEFLPETAVLDTWATSSITPLLHQSRGLIKAPMNMRSHAHEIIRTWTFYSIVRSLYHTGRLPWQELMISGFVLAKRGEKISKSKGNAALDPARLIETHSADALRYWAANARLGADTFFSVEELSASRRFLTKLWNASRFVISRLDGMDASAVPALLPTDRWILARTAETALRAQTLLDSFEAGPARHEIDDLFWKDFCDNYIELVKERLYGEDGPEKQAAQHTLCRVLLSLLKLYAIYVPHITEAIYLSYFREREGAASLHLLHWDTPVPPEQCLLRFGEDLKAAVSEMRKYKTEHGLSMKSELPEFSVRTGESLRPLFEASARDLLACSHAKRLSFRV